jgi:hypothetical protein
MRHNKQIELIREFPDRSIKWLLETPDNLHGLLLVVAENLADMIDYKRIKNISSKGPGRTRKAIKNYRRDNT